MSELELANAAVGWLAARAKDLGGKLAERLTSEAEKRLFDWLVGRFETHGKSEELNDALAMPADEVAVGGASGDLARMLRKNPDLAAELEALWRQANAIQQQSTTNQTSTIGDNSCNNTVVQISGSGGIGGGGS